MSEFVDKAKKVHGDKYDYSQVEYINSTTKVKIICKNHGEFLQTPKIHYKSNCPKCSRESQINLARKTKEEFIRDSKDVYGEKYNYDSVEYKNNKEPVKISCSICGIFEVRPDLHLKGSSCKCNKKKTKSTDKDLFLETAYKIHKDKYDYTNTEIKGSKNKIDVLCREHGTFTLSISNHLQGQGCPKCTQLNYSKLRRKTTEDFIKEAVETHGNKCDYSNTIYKTCKEKVTIKCNIHNEYFTVFPYNHLIGGSCRQCLSENLSKSLTGREGTCGYSKDGYIRQANGREAYVYLIRCYNEQEEFYKIGKTFLNINSRFTKSNLCYDFEEIYFHYGNAGDIYDLENELHKRYKDYKYKPLDWFAGYTECYSLDLPIKEIVEL